MAVRARVASTENVTEVVRLPQIKIKFEAIRGIDKSDLVWYH
jgi:hypothetical protein